MNQYPCGKLNDEDEDAFNIEMMLTDKTFIINFGKPIAWIGMSKDEAFEFARRIMRLVCDDVVELPKPGQPAGAVTISAGILRNGDG